MHAEYSNLPVDLELVAQRILKVAEVATLEHLEALMRSQAAGMVEWAREPAAADRSQA